MIQTTIEKLDASKLITRHFKLSNYINGYEKFSNAAKEKALKVILSNE